MRVHQAAALCRAVPPCAAAGVKACVKVSANPLGGQGFSGDGGAEAALKDFNQLASETPALMMDPNTGGCVGLRQCLVFLSLLLLRLWPG